MIDLPAMITGSMALNPQPWPCQLCTRLVLRARAPGQTEARCITPTGTQTRHIAHHWQPQDAAPAWCPRTPPFSPLRSL